jgi:hypothetical protein
MELQESQFQGRSFPSIGLTKEEIVAGIADGTLEVGCLDVYGDGFALEVRALVIRSLKKQIEDSPTSTGLPERLDGVYRYNPGDRRNLS